MKNPRPPKAWMHHMKTRIRKQYPDRDDLDRIISGIWWSYPQETRDRLIKEYDSQNPKVQMLECPFCHEKNPVSRAGTYLKCKCGKNLVSVKIRHKSK